MLTSRYCRIELEDVVEDRIEPEDIAADRQTVWDIKIHQTTGRQDRTRVYSNRQTDRLGQEDTLHDRQTG